MKKRERLHEAAWAAWEAGNLTIAELRWVIIKINWKFKEREDA